MSYKKQTQDILLRFIIDQKGLTATKKLLETITKENQSITQRKRISNTTGLGSLLSDNDMAKLTKGLEKGERAAGRIKTDLVDAADYLQRAFAGSAEEYNRIRRQKLAEEVQHIADEMRVPIGRAVEEIIKRQGMSIKGYRGGRDLEQAIEESMALGGKKSVETIAQEFKKLARIGMTGFTLVMAGMRIKAAGQNMITGPTNQATQYYGNTKIATAGFINALKSMERSGVRFGALVSKQLTPLFEKLAEKIQEIVDFVEEHPLLAKAYTKTAVGLFTGGIGIMAVGQLLSGVAAFASFGTLLKAENVGGKFIASMKTFANTVKGMAGIKGFSLAGAGSKALGALFSPIGMATAGVATGVGVYNAIAEAKDLDRAGTIVGKSLANLAYSLGSFKDMDTAEKWFWSVGTALGVLKENADKVGPSLEDVSAYIQYLKADADALTAYQDEVANSNKNYQKSITSLEEDYQKQRQDLIDQMNKTLVDDEKDTANERTKAAEDLQKTLRRMEEDYYIKRRQLSEEYNIDVQRAEEDHQRKMRQMSEDNNLKIRDLAEKRDAFGIVRQMESYEIDRRRAEEEYSIEAARRSQDFARRLAEMEAEYQLERARRIEDFQDRLREDDKEKAIRKAREKADLEEKLKELDAQHKEDLERMALEHDEELAQMEEQYNKEREKRRIAFNDQLRDLNAYLLGEVELRDQYYQGMSRQLESWLSSMNGQFESALPGYPSSGNRDNGGYTDDGYYKMKRGEFVMTPQTAAYFERMMGGRLNQDKLISSLGGRNKTVVIKADLTVSSMDPVASLRTEMKEVATKVLYDSFGGNDG